METRSAKDQRPSLLSEGFSVLKGRAMVRRIFRGRQCLASKVLAQTFWSVHPTLPGMIGSGSENCIPDCGRRVVFDAKPSEFELTFSDPMHEFNTGDGDRGAPKPLQSKHWTQAEFGPLAVKSWSRRLGTTGKEWRLSVVLLKRRFCRARNPLSRISRATRRRPITSSPHR
jgi:hypothetical protein